MTVSDKNPGFGRTIAGVGLGLSTALPLGSAFAAPRNSYVATHSTQKSVQAAKSRTFWGARYQTRYGPIEVGIVVQGKKIRSVKVVNTPDSARGTVLQHNAIPVLKSETLKAQSAKIHVYSGATQTSSGYISSLSGAVKKARKAKAL
jgi:uncharacterized protein with FMN-binding domain